MEFDSEHVIGTQVLIKIDILENSYYFLLSICENENATQMQIPRTDELEHYLTLDNSTKFSIKWQIQVLQPCNSYQNRYKTSFTYLKLENVVGYVTRMLCI
jgi:hypothetical protein